MEPFWEENYKKDDIIAFSAEPNTTVKEYEPLMLKNGNILEIGCGEGQNVLYLAKKGFLNIDAFDLSKYGIQKLKKHCQHDNLQINAFIQDLSCFEFNKNYDLT